MRAEPRIEYLASDEDGRDWFGREGVSRLRVLREAQSLSGEKLRHYRARKTWMRPAVVPHDCPVASELHNVADLDADPPDGCRCRELAEDGWMFVCDASNAAAIPAWEVKYGYTLVPWSVRRRLRALHPRERRMRRAPVLWGGKLERRARWFDQVLLGRGYVLVRGDLWHVPYAVLEEWARQRRERWARERTTRRAA